MARTRKIEQSAATLGFEAELWSAADEMRGHISAAEYRQVLTGLIFLRYVSAAGSPDHARGPVFRLHSTAFDCNRLPSEPAPV
jgi:hypothetical protein